MGTMINTGTDVVGFLEGQHQEVELGFKAVLESKGKAREAAFQALRRLLAIHETAEEEIVHPKARQVLPDGERIVTARLEEESKAKKVLSELEELDMDSTEFDTMLRSLQSDVIAHAESEENEEFKALRDHLDTSALAQMRRVAEFAEKVAPTRPHAGIESAVTNLLAGPFASMVDRTRDAISGKR
jgi:hemerythrin superfamily protein